MAAMATVKVANHESLSWTAWMFHINLAAVMGAEPKAFVEVVQQGQWLLSGKGAAGIWRETSEPQNVKKFCGDSWS